MGVCMDSLLPPKSSPLERKLAKVGARISDLPVPIKTLWNPWTCPAHLLPWLAWSLGVEIWPTYWTEQQRRQAIADSLQVKRLKGTVAAVRQVIAAMGAGLALREWWQKAPQGEPHTFEVLLTLADGANRHADYQIDLLKEIERVKPARSHFTLNLGIEAQGRLGLIGGARPVIYRRLTLTEAT